MGAELDRPRGNNDGRPPPARPLRLGDPPGENLNGRQPGNQHQHQDRINAALVLAWMRMENEGAEIPAVVARMAALNRRMPIPLNLAAHLEMHE